MTQKGNIPETSEFKNFVELISVYTAASHQLEQLENEANQSQLDLVDECLGEYTKLQETITKTEEALQLIALQHPEWFGGKASIKTPYGTAKFSHSRSLEVVNEELSIELIERDLATSMTTKASDFVRTVKSLNLEALETLSDGELLKYKIQRIQKKTFSVSAAKLDMGKAVKAAEAKRQEAQPKAA